MFVMQTLQSLVLLAVIVAAAFLAAKIITNAVAREAAREEEARRVSLAYLMAVPEPEAAPRAQLRLVWSGPGMPEDVPYDQMKELAR
jgi:outer membrane lipoprotein-sorting protein